MAIRHSDAEPTPRFGTRYRCHICRLELVLDASGRKLTVPPFDDGDDGQKHPPGN